jgi:thiol-disulfide isomerase/thioredoxin
MSTQKGIIFGVIASTLASMTAAALLASPNGVHPETFVLTAADTPRRVAPSFRVTTFAQEVISKESLKGHPALLMFWAPWCQVCQRELPLLAKFYLHDKPAMLKVLAIGFADTPSHVEQFVKGHPNTFVFPTAYDKADEVAQLFGVFATPTFVALDAQGNISLVHRGGGLRDDPQYLGFLATLQ